MDHYKSTILLIFGTLSVGGHPMRPKLILEDKGHMSTSPECTDTVFKLAVRFRVHAGRAKLLRTEISGRRPPASKLF
jgi:hypothetical protein